MGDKIFPDEIEKRRTFAIISHPDAGKTTVTEKLLLLCGVINSAGTIRARKSSKHATSDWMEIEQQRGISVTSSVMQFEYRNHVINLLDTPGHEDFSEDTYRTLTAVDSALMVIDAARGVEERTIKLLEVCRERNTPVITFINKLDRSARDPLDLIDEIESVLKIKCAPSTWPIGSGQEFEGLYDFQKSVLLPYQRTSQIKGESSASIDGIRLQDASNHPHFSRSLDKLVDDIELLQGAGTTFDKYAYLEAMLTPVFFGSALRNFGVQEMLDCFVENAPGPQPRQTNLRNVQPDEPTFSGFVFKIQANMDPNHRDRIAFIRICSGKYEEGKRLVNVRSKKETQIKNAIRFMAKGRTNAKAASPGDILGFYNHGTIQVGDTFTEGEQFNFKGIPNFAPEIFRLVRTADPLKTKALSKGLKQLCEEGAVQVFNYIDGNQVVLGAVGALQFDVVAWRLKNEYAVECTYNPINISTARWLFSETPNRLDEIKKMETSRLALDGANQLAYLAPTAVNLQLAQERWPDVRFSKTREMSE